MTTDTTVRGGPMARLRSGAHGGAAHIAATELEELYAAAGSPPASARCSSCATGRTLSEAEIADALGISRGSVKSTSSRALDALENILSEEGHR